MRSLIRRKKYRSYRGEIGAIAPNLLQRDFKSNQPDLKWASEITELKVKDKKLYLSPIIELLTAKSLVTVSQSRLTSNRSLIC